MRTQSTYKDFSSWNAFFRSDREMQSRYSKLWILFLIFLSFSGGSSVPLNYVVGKCSCVTVGINSLKQGHSGHYLLMQKETRVIIN